MAEPEAPVPHPDARPPKLLDQLRQALRPRHYSRRTEEAYSLGGAGSRGVGLGTVAIGMTIEEASRVAQVPFEPWGSPPEPATFCTCDRGELADQGVVRMVLGPCGNERTGHGVAITASSEKGVTAIWVGRYRGIRESEGCN